MSILAINGGSKIRASFFPSDNVIGVEEEHAVHRVFQSGVFSKYVASWHENFYGGDEVQALEREWAEYYGVKHAVSVNSATSALYIAAAASGIGPGDEVIVCPYTMSASASAPLIFNAVPVFADIERDYFCLDPLAVEKLISERTKVVIVVDIFGQIYNVKAINELARKHHLLVIEDAAQAPGGMYKGNMAGSFGDIGVFSLNYHKHIHSGEGGVAVTDDDELADRMRMIRNHAEVIADQRDLENLNNLVGFNFRMTEIEAAIAREQLKKLDQLLAKRIENVGYLNSLLKDVPCLTLPRIRPDSKHSFYKHALKYSSSVSGVSRDRFVDAIKAELSPIENRENEGVIIGNGYVKPVHLQKMYQKRVLYGGTSCPFDCPNYSGSVSYEKGICPVCESFDDDGLITHELIYPAMNQKDLEDVASAFIKVWENRQEVQDI